MTDGKKPQPRQLEARRQIPDDAIVTWKDNSNTEIALTVADVGEFFRGKHSATQTEKLLFLQVARSLRANPFLGDVYLIKYSPTDAAAILVGYHYFMARAQANPNYEGYELFYVDGEGKRIADGLETATNVRAAICLVYHKGRRIPAKFIARMSEFNRGQALWKTHQIMMLGKCAIGNGHRLGDPGLRKMVLQEEIGQGYVEAEFEEVPATDEPPERLTEPPPKKEKEHVAEPPAAAGEQAAVVDDKGNDPWEEEGDKPTETASPPEEAAHVEGSVPGQRTPAEVDELTLKDAQDMVKARLLSAFSVDDEKPDGPASTRWLKAKVKLGKVSQMDAVQCAEVIQLLAKVADGALVGWTGR